MASSSKASGSNGEDEKENKSKRGKFNPFQDSGKLVVIRPHLDYGWPKDIPLVLRRAQIEQTYRYIQINEAMKKIKPLPKLYEIVLYFDNSLTDQIHKARKTLGNLLRDTHLIEIKSSRPDIGIPRITLFTTPSADPSKLKKIIKTISLNKNKIPLSLSSIGTLPNDENNVVLLSPTPSTPLLELHFQLCEALKIEGIEIGENYKPDSWVPFYSVAKKLSKDRIEEAITVIKNLNLSFDGYARLIRLVEFRPDVRELFSDVEKEAILMFKKRITPTDAMLNRFSITKKEAEDFPGLECGKSVDIKVYDPEGKRWLDMVLTRYMNYTYYISTDWKMLTRYMYHINRGPRGLVYIANGMYRNNKSKTVITSYMKSAKKMRSKIWKVAIPEPKKKFVAGAVIVFYKLKKDNVFVFPYQYMIRIEKGGKSSDSSNDDV